jgi:hypothetical protein
MNRAWRKETNAEVQSESHNCRKYFKNVALENKVKYVTM